MGFIGQTRYLDFRVVDLNSNPITGILLSTFVVNPMPAATEETDEYSPTQNTIIFERDNVPCTDVLSLFDHQDGRYTLLYVPTAAGHDYVDTWVAAYGIRDIDIEEIANTDTSLSSNVANLNQDYLSPGYLRITAANPQTYTLFVFNSSDWEQGRQDTSFALGSSSLDTSGNWVNTLTVATPGTYHIVIMNSTTTQVAFPFLSVG